MRTDFGLGETQHDVFVRSYSRHDPYFDGYEMVTVDDLDLPEGVAMWVRVRPVNNGRYSGIILCVFQLSLKIIIFKVFKSDSM